MTIRTVDLFAGAGGLSLGFEAAGFDLVAAYDNWEAARLVYEANFSHPIMSTDLSDAIKAAEEIARWNPDLIIGGPPCQDFSSAGPRDESLGRADLTISFASIVTEIEPLWFVMENVERARKSWTVTKAKEILRGAGYGLTEVVLDASLCGAPQKRKRLILIGELGGNDDALLDDLEDGLDETPMTLRDYFGDSLGTEHYYRHPRTYARRGVFSIDEPSPTVRGVNRPIPDGYPGHPGDTADVNSDVRPLTTEERAQVQTFPAEFEWIGTKSDKEQLIGNAVPVKLGEYVAKILKAYIEKDQSSIDLDGELELAGN